MVVQPLAFELGRGTIPQLTMGAHVVVLLPKALDEAPRLSQRGEGLRVEAFVAQRAIEAFGDAVFPGMTGRDAERAGVLRRQPGAGGATAAPPACG